MDEQSPLILVDFDEPGLKQVSLRDITAQKLAELTATSRAAVENALDAIGWMADKAREAIGKAHEQPDSVEVEFGIKVGTKAGVIVAQADAEAHIKVTVIWNREK